MTLYKYSSAKWGIAILRDLRLKVSPPNSFNDPFEFTPQTLNPLKDVKSAYAVFQRNGLPCSFDCFQEKLWPWLCQDVQLKEQFVRENISDDLNEKDKASEFVGVLCLSQLPDDIRMWSHYAQNHTGITIGLDVSN